MHNERSLNPTDVLPKYVHLSCPRAILTDDLTQLLHADRNAIVGEHAGEGHASELTALVCVEDIGLVDRL
jgi:hypothetical protein